MMNHDTPVFAMPLIRFLLDRIDEDETLVERLARRESRGADPQERTKGIARTERLRADLIAKRHMIGDLQQLVVLRDLPVEAPVRRLAVGALCAMAMPYRDHPRFRPDWSARALAHPGDEVDPLQQPA